MAVVRIGRKMRDMRRTAAILIGALAISLAATAGTARAGGGLLGGLVGGLLGGNCGASAPVFAPWGDWSSYYFAPNGGFESGSKGWTLRGGANVVSGGEPWFLSGFGSHSLQIPEGGSATMSVCYGVTTPSLRFLDDGVGGPATVRVTVIPHSLLGILSIIDGGTFQTGSNWAPSPKISALGSALAAPLGTKSLELRFTVESGTANIDDLFVDPFAMKG
jgi:hypothetical protein